MTRQTFFSLDEPKQHTAHLAVTYEPKCLAVSCSSVCSGWYVFYLLSQRESHSPLSLEGGTKHKVCNLDSSSSSSALQWSFLVNRNMRRRFFVPSYVCYMNTNMKRTKLTLQQDLKSVRHTIYHFPSVNIHSFTSSVKLVSYWTNSDATSKHKNTLIPLHKRFPSTPI